MEQQPPNRLGIKEHPRPLSVQWLISTITEHNTTPPNKCAAKILHCNSQPHTTIFHTSGASNISYTLQKALSRRI